MVLLSILSVIRQSEKSGGSCENFLVPVFIVLGLLVSIYITQSLGGNGHLNPAVSTTMTIAGNLKIDEMLYHVLSQILGGVCAYFLFNSLSN